MKIEQEIDDVDEREKAAMKKGKKVKTDTKKKIIGAGARILFYPTLLYNVIRYKTQPSFRWWDHIDEYLLLGAVPFVKDVPELKELGVVGVITLNESFETLVPSSTYKVHGIEHLVLPTRDYLYAPSFDDIDRAVEFIHRNASRGGTTYVHCKAGRGRSPTIAACYLVKYKQMTPSDALELIRLKRPRVELTSMQKKAVEQYSKSFPHAAGHSPSGDDAVLITTADLEGYEKSCEDTFCHKPEIIPKSVKAPSVAKRLSSYFTSRRKRPKQK